MKPKILIINQSQFGYHTDYLQYASLLKDEFDVLFVCWNYGFVEIVEDGVTVSYISRAGNVFQRNFRFIRACLDSIKRQNYHCVFVHYFRGSSIVPLTFNQKGFIHLDIRSGSVSKNPIRRGFYNAVLRLESFSFKSISVISEGLRDQLKIKPDSHIFPLGATPHHYIRKNRHKLDLLYVGTLTDRNIEETIAGLAIFLSANPDADIRYIIVGGGTENEVDRLRQKIKSSNVGKYVYFKGYVPHKDLIKYYTISNVGVSYIPITTYFEFQPATKTYEYLMSGMPVIATATHENKKIINESNGILINDTAESVAEALRTIYDRITEYREDVIRSTVAEFEWEKIIRQMKRALFKV